MSVFKTTELIIFIFQTELVGKYSIHENIELLMATSILYYPEISLKHGQRTDICKELADGTVDTCAIVFACRLFVCPPIFRPPVLVINKIIVF